MTQVFLYPQLISVSGICNIFIKEMWSDTFRKVYGCDTLILAFFKLIFINIDPTNIVNIIKIKSFQLFSFISHKQVGRQQVTRPVLSQPLDDETQLNNYSYIHKDILWYVHGK